MLKLSSFVALYFILCMGARCDGLKFDIPGQIIASAFTPFHPNEDINYEMIPKLAQMYAENNITNILIAEWFGGCPLIQLCERQALVAAWMKAAGPLGLNIIVEVGCLPFSDTLTLVKFCRDLNVKAISVYPEQFYKAQTLDELIGDLIKISNVAPDLAMLFDELISNDPIFSTVDVYLAAVKKVRSFVGVITNPNTAQDIKAVASIAGKVIWIYDNQYIGGTLVNGLNGTMTTAPNLFPQIVLELVEAVRRCDRQKASDLQERLNQLFAAICNLDGGPINTYSRDYFVNLKAAFRLIKGDDLGERAPFEKATPAVVNQIATNLKRLGVKLARSN